MRALVELLSVEGGTKAKGDAGAEEHVVGNSGHTAVVDLSLMEKISLQPPKSRVHVTLAKERGSILYLLATSNPTCWPALESQTAFAPASTWELTLW